MKTKVYLKIILESLGSCNIEIFFHNDVENTVDVSDTKKGSFECFNWLKEGPLRSYFKLYYEPLYYGRYDFVFNYKEIPEDILLKIIQDMKIILPSQVKENYIIKVSNNYYHFIYKIKGKTVYYIKFYKLENVKIEFNKDNNYSYNVRLVSINRVKKLFFDKIFQ